MHIGATEYSQRLCSLSRQGRCRSAVTEAVQGKALCVADCDWKMMVMSVTS